MSDTLTRVEPVRATSFAATGVTISLAPPMARFSLRARDPKLLEALLDRKIPANIGEVQDGIACLGPDEWLMRAPLWVTISAGNDRPVAVVDVSHRSISLIVEGPRAAEIVMSGCPLDLHRFASGRATRTIYETVEIVIIRDPHERFHIEVWRSFAPWLWTALTTAAKH